ncbi:MAG: DUF523 domain-containing protein [Gammaproteobacteria bacterium]|nr:DUF523 domain-containing protein [Gammaproteobacteria bacterium]MDH5728023.1 DUF523 domain-containing protein [Gammaproteobacteria bacterium]
MLKPPIRIGVSACLLGQSVRYDGGHKQLAILQQEIFQSFDLLAICPEVAIGLSVPRKPMHIIVSANEFRAVQIQNPSLDFTDQLKQYALKIASESLHGFICKSRSPSCGYLSTPVHSEVKPELGSGIFAQQLKDYLPRLPMLEDTDLSNNAACRLFIEQVLAYFHAQK